MINKLLKYNRKEVNRDKDNSKKESKTGTKTVCH